MVAQGAGHRAQGAGARPEPYPVLVESGAIERVGEVAERAAPAYRYAVITDTNVARLYAARVRDALGASRTRVYEIPPGESEKTRERWAHLTDAMLADGFGRDAAVIALGGGVIGDLAGFVAASYMRGIPVVQVPTSLIAMIDAAIGGKTGVDTPAGKNLVGAFHQPAAVVADPSVLESLPREHLRAGLAEAIKHGVVRDADYFEMVVAAAPGLADAGPSALRPGVLAAIVQRSIAIKLAVVSADERESGLRKILNFGHTVGHAIELVSAYTMLHGNAVAIGMVIEASLAERLGVADAGTADAVARGVRVARLPDALPDSAAPDALLRAMRLDKKVRGGSLELALPARIGAMAGASAGWTITASEDSVLEVLR